MRVAVAGAGSVGRSIAAELVDNGHQVLLIDRSAAAITPELIEAAEWVQADACEVASLEEAGLQTCDVVIACTGDDKVNLVLALLAKTEFAVGRIVGRVNDPRNEWLFNESWGVDVAVSTPRILASLVEEAVSVGDLVRLFELRQGKANLVEVTLPSGAAIADHPVRDLTLPPDAALVTILRGGRVIVPQPDEPLESGDELLLVATPAVEREVRAALS
jgi:trk system potassium uptake protein TrkA